MGAKTKRVRPSRSEGAGIVWKAWIHAFYCEGCEDHIEIRSRREYDDAEFVASMKEMLIVDHTECWEFDDPEMARQARRWRKKKKLRENLAAQAASWRGRGL